MSGPEEDIERNVKIKPAEMPSGDAREKWPSIIALSLSLPGLVGT